MKKILAILATTVAIVVALPSLVAASTTADITVQATPQSISITVDPTTYDFGYVDVSTTPVTGIAYFTIDNTSNVVTDQTVSVNASTWSGGVTWVHNDDHTPGSDQAGMQAGVDDADDLYDVDVQFVTPNILANDQAASTDYDFGLKLYAPTAFTDTVEKEIKVRITAAAAS